MINCPCCQQPLPNQNPKQDELSICPCGVKVCLESTNTSISAYIIDTALDQNKYRLLFSPDSPGRIKFVILTPANSIPKSVLSLDFVPEINPSNAQRMTERLLKLKAFL